MTADKYDDLAKTAGAAAGLTPEQIPGLAHILRELAKGERAAERERCARVAESAMDRAPDDEGPVRLWGWRDACENIAAAIRDGGS